MISLFILFLLTFVNLLNGQTSNNCLLPGDSLSIGNSLFSINGQFKLTLITKGNICIYNTSDNSIRWCSGFLSPSAQRMSLNINGNFAIVKTNNIAIWSPKIPITSFMTNIKYALISNNGNFIIYNNDNQIVWSCFKGTFSRSIYSKCTVTSAGETINDTCNNPTIAPTIAPTTPTIAPTIAPTITPTIAPTITPTTPPTRSPTTPTRSPTTRAPTAKPKPSPTAKPITLAPI